MKPRRTILTLTCALAALIARSETPALQAAAEQAYTKGEYAQALALYDSLDRSQTSASLLFNIGNCHMKLGDVPHAILYYERAVRSQPGAEDIRSNLEYARTLVVDRVNALPAFSLGSVWDRVRGGKDVDQWARRSLIACMLTFFAACGWVLVRPRAWKRLLLGLSLVGVLATAGAMGLAAYRVSETTDRSEAIIMMPKVDVRGEPREASTTLFVLHEGTKVSVLQEQQGWYEVKLSSGTVGWAPPSSLVVI